MWVLSKSHKKLSWPFYRWMSKSLEENIQAYRVRKGWDQSDTPKRLAKSIFVEAAELLECFKEEPLNTKEMAYELADVLMYAYALAKEFDLNVENLIYEKWEDLDTRYPDVD